MPSDALTTNVAISADYNHDPRLSSSTSASASNRPEFYTTMATTTATVIPDFQSEYDESQCLFCNQKCADLDQNLAHMSKDHGLHIDTTNLLVDVASLLAYMHLLIFDCHECLYCGTQRHTRQAVQQHMMAKGHCKYDIEDEDSELRDFYQTSSQRDEIQHNVSFLRLSDDLPTPSRAMLRRTRALNRPEQNRINRSTSPDDKKSSDVSASAEASPVREPPKSTELSTRSSRQKRDLKIQLAQLRVGDRQSLAHLPASQQRALLATHHKQMEQGRRAEQTYQGNLDGAGNKFGRLSTIRLIRKPPHTGNIHSLNR